MSSPVFSPRSSSEAPRARYSPSESHLLRVGVGIRVRVRVRVRITVRVGVRVGVRVRVSMRIRVRVRVLVPPEVPLLDELLHVPG